MNRLKYLSRRRDWRRSGASVQRRTYRPRTDLSDLIDAIRTQGQASLAEERREDRSKRRREWITIILLAGTMIAIGWQVFEMRRTYGPIVRQAFATARSAAATKEAADAAVRQVKDAENSLLLAQRAWVGPTNAALAAEPKAGKPIDVNITYQNTGREPALNFIYDVDPFVTNHLDNLTSADVARIGSFQQACQTGTRSSGGSVVYPATGFSSYTLSTKVAAGVFDARFWKGREDLVIQGCFWYRTFNVQKHSYFCYFYHPKQTKIANLNICAVGADAN